MKCSPILGCLMLISVFIVGCSSPPDDQAADDHGHEHNHSSDTRISYESLVAEICEHRDSIKAAFEADKRDEAHDPLHEIGHFITALPDAAAETDLAEADWNQVKEASDKLMEAFGQVDALFHDTEGGRNFGDVEQDISAAIAVLNEKVALISKDGGESQP